MRNAYAIFVRESDKETTLET